MATLNEYYTGCLELPVCNGVTDGSFLIIGGLILTTILGCEIWVIPVTDVSWMQVEGVETINTG